MRRFLIGGWAVAGFLVVLGVIVQLVSRSGGLHSLGVFGTGLGSWIAAIWLLAVIVAVISGGVLQIGAVAMPVVLRGLASGGLELLVETPPPIRVSGRPSEILRGIRTGGLSLIFPITYQIYPEGYYQPPAPAVC